MLMCRETWRLWVYCAVLIGYIIIFNIGFNLLLAFLGRAPLRSIPSFVIRAAQALLSGVATGRTAHQHAMLAGHVFDSCS
jgi:Plant PDR ABC transporter associated